MKPKVSLPVKNKKIEDLLLWRDPKKSAIALGAILVGYVLTNFLLQNPVVIAANTLQVAVIGALFWNIISGVLKQPPLPLPSRLTKGVSEAEVKDFAARACVYVNKMLAFSHRVLSGKDFLLTVQTSAALFVTGKVASVASPLTLMLIGVILAFSLPKAYELKKDEIDNAIGKAREQYSTIYANHVDPLVKKIPRASSATYRPTSSSTSSAASRATQAPAVTSARTSAVAPGQKPEDTDIFY